VDKDLNLARGSASGMAAQPGRAQPWASTLTQRHNGDRYNAAIRVMQKMEPRERPPAPPPNVR
jgi:hypothetical protein